MFHARSKKQALKSDFFCLKKVIYFTYKLLVTFYGTVVVDRYESTFKTTDDILN